MRKKGRIWEALNLLLYRKKIMFKNTFRLPARMTNQPFNIETLLFAMADTARLSIRNDSSIDENTIKPLGICSDGRVGYDLQSGEYVLQPAGKNIVYRVLWPEGSWGETTIIKISTSPREMGKTLDNILHASLCSYLMICAGEHLYRQGVLHQTYDQAANRNTVAIESLVSLGVGLAYVSYKKIAPKKEIILS
jgi:hypothetical protein